MENDAAFEQELAIKRYTVNIDWINENIIEGSSRLPTN